MKIIELFKVNMPELVTEEITKTLKSGYIAEGEKVKKLTSTINKFIGTQHTVLVNSCTSALKLAYILSGVTRGTEVITTPLTCIASNTPILELGGKPVWADVDTSTGMITANTIKKVLTDRTKAILLLHKEGDPARLSEILSLAKKNGIKVIEDAAHAFGAKYRGVKIGNHGDFVCFSFQAIKHMTTGDGGALICKSNADYLLARKMKWFGLDKEQTTNANPWQNDIDILGYKYNMNDISATIGLSSMENYDYTLNLFHENGEYYNHLLKDIPGISLIRRSKKDFSSYWAYSLLVDNRTALIDKLSQEGINSGHIHHRNDVYTLFADSKSTLPGVDYISKHDLSLPSGWWVTQNDIERIVTIIKSGW